MTRFEPIRNDLDEFANTEEERKDGSCVADPLQDGGEFDGFHGLFQLAHNITHKREPCSTNSGGDIRTIVVSPGPQVTIARSDFARRPSATEIVRPLESIAETQPQLQPALLRLFAILARSPSVFDWRSAHNIS